MRRFALLPLLALGGLLVGCADAPPTPAQQAQLVPQIGIPQADPNVTPTGSHVRGATPDPFMCTVTPYDFDHAPTNTTGSAIFYSTGCGAYVNHH